MNEITLINQRLSITISICDQEEYDTLRFDRSCRVKNILLDGKHSFAQVEQTIPARQTSNGFGLSAEFVVDGLGTTTKSGDYFYKPGVGLLLQTADYKPYGIFDAYTCIPDQLSYEAGTDSIHFTLKNATAGIQINRELKLIENQLKLTTMIQNNGQSPLSMMEYQHNFFALDNAPVEPGYHLSIPYMKDMTQATWESSGLDEKGAANGPVPMPLIIEPHQISWNRAMKNNAYYVCFSSDQIADSPSYRWELSHDNLPLRVSEEMDFKPVRQDVWGIEHVICAEAFKEIKLNPCETETYTRTWTFEK